MKKLLLTIILFIVPTIKVHGYYCNYQDVARYKKIASNINYSYEYEEFDGNVIFHVTLTNLNEAMYLKDSNSNIYNYTSNEIVVDAKSGEKLKIYVYPTDEYCDDELLRLLNIQLPTYNAYYTDPVCAGVSGYDLCNKWSTHNLSYEKFVESVTNYKNSLKKQKKEKLEEEKTWLYYLIEFLSNYYYIILILVIALASTIIYIRGKKDNIYN